MSIARFQDVHRRYQSDTPVLEGISFQLAAGEVVGLLGRNGAGKTTLIRVAMGMMQPQRGQARLFEMDPWRKRLEVKRRVGYVSEEQILPDFLTVREVFDLHRTLFPAWDPQMAVALARRYELPPRARIRELSKGQARQVALIGAVSHRPELLILDEPAGGLDPAARREFLETSIHLLNEEGSAVLFSSHHMHDVERLAQRVVVLNEGVVCIDSELDELREESCLVLVPRGGRLGKGELLAMPGCLGVRARNEALHAIFAQDPETVRNRLYEILGHNGIQCTRVGLEDLFVELLGGPA